jgi:Bacterial Ig-like domain
VRRAVRFALPALLLAAVLAVPHGSVASSYMIVPGGAPVTVATTAANENVNVNFTGTAGQRISVKLSSVTFGTSTCCSTKVSVLKPDGLALVAPTNVGRNGGFLDVKTLPVSGSYRIFIDPQGTVTGSMVVTLYDVPPDAAVTTTPGGAPVSVATTTPGQNAVATFSGSAGNRIGLKMTNVTIGTSATASTKVSLLKPDGTTLVAPMNVGTRGAFLEALLPTAGTYKVFIDPLTSSTGGMTLTLYDVPPDVVAPITAGGAPLTLTTTVPGQNAKATFTGALNQRVSLKIGPVSLTTAADTARISITKPDGTALVTAANYSSIGGFVDLKVLPVPGTYTIAVDPQSAATGSVTLTLYDVPADFLAPITFTTPLTVTTTTPGQNARATFTGAAGQQVGVRVTGVTIGPSPTGSTKVSLLRPDGTALKSLTLGTNGGTLTPSVLPLAGVYTVLVDPQSFATGSATLTLQDVAPDVTGSILPDGNPVTVTTTTASQNARLTFSGTAGQAVSMKMKYAPATCCTANVSILKPDGTILVSPIGVGTVEKFMDAKTLPVTGTYTVLVDPQGTSTGTMTLTLYLVPADVTATIAPGGPPVTVTTTSAGQNARLTFAGTAGDGLVVTIGPACCATAVSILKPDGTTLVSPKAIAITGGKVYTRLTVTGTHTILVDYQSTALGSVTVQLSIDNTAPAPPVLSLLEPTSDSHVAGTSFFYRPAGAGGSLTVTATTSDGGAGVQRVDFPGLSGGFTPTGIVSDLTSPYSRVYTWVTGATLNNTALTVTVRDNVGNTSSATFAVRPDSAAPTTTDNTAAIGSAWKNTNQTVTLTPSDGAGSGVAATHYTSNGATPTTASPQGTSVALTADGVYTVRYFSVDNVANAEAVKTAGTQIRIDKTPPSSATLNALPAQIRNGQVLSGTATDALSGIVSLSYVYCAGASCTPTVLIGSSSAAPSYPVTWVGQPVDGTYQVLARATDAAGNTLDSAKRTVVVDNSPPDTTITASPASPSTQSVSFSFTSTQAGSTFECELDAGGFTACTSPKAYTGLSGGSHTFRVRATDPAGNADTTPAAHTWTVDALAPNTTITSNPPALSSSASAAFSFTSTETGTFECALDGGGFGPCTSPQSYSGLGDGSHTFQVRATDPAGNPDGTPAAYTWTIDTAAPNTTITASPSNPSSSAAASFSFTATEPGSTFECALDGGGFSSCTSPQSYSGLSDGSHTFQVRAADGVGNTDATPASSTWTVDTAAPSSSITGGPSDPSNDAAPTFTFAADEAGSSFECRLDGGAFATCTSPHVLAALTEGSHTFTVRAVDLAGNIGPNDSRTWTVDLSAPQTTISSGPSDPTPDTFADFAFDSSEPGSTFQCELDGGGFSACASPQNYSGLAAGSHTFSVYATDAAGNVDGTPATFTWTIS